MEDYRSKSFWLESLPQTITPNPVLSGSKKTNVVVIGGGYTGLSTGYHLKQINPDLEVSILESDICGYGASGRNGGFSMTLFGLTKGITKFRFNDKKARAAQVYMEEAVDYLHDFIELNNIDCDYEQSGYLLVGTSPAQVKRGIFSYIEMFYNCKRRHSFLDNLSPKNYEKLWEMQKAA